MIHVQGKQFAGESDQSWTQPMGETRAGARATLQRSSAQNVSALSSGYGGRARRELSSKKADERSTRALSAPTSSL